MKRIVNDFLESIDVNNVNVETHRETRYFNRIIAGNDDLLDEDVKEDRIKYAKLAIYLYNNLPYDVVRGIAELYND